MCEEEEDVFYWRQLIMLLKNKPPRERVMLLTEWKDQVRAACKKKIVMKLKLVGSWKFWKWMEILIFLW
jgi:hypothetical protein